MNNSKRRRLAAEAVRVTGNKPLPRDASATGGSSANRVTRRHGILVAPKLVIDRLTQAIEPVTPEPVTSVPALVTGEEAAS